MAQIRTHYDNLKVTQNASPEIIRAAYKILSQKYHPDRNQDNAEAVRIMVIINGAYEVLSSPDRRKEYDQWLAKQKLDEQQNKVASRPPPSPRPTPAQMFTVRPQHVNTAGANSQAVIGFLVVVFSGWLAIGAPYTAHQFVDKWHAAEGWFNASPADSDRIAVVQDVQKAADRGNAYAQYNLGSMYGDGRGVPKDLKAALYWIEKSAGAGQPNAQTSLGWAYMSNYLELPHNHQLAMKWNLEASKQGFGRGSENIGLLYENGWGVPVNYVEAANWYKKAIAQGANSGQAELHLGGLYENGFGVQKNLNEAVNLYRTVVEKFGNSEDASEAKIRLDSILDQHHSHAQK